MPQINETTDSTSNGGAVLNVEPDRQPSKSSMATPEKPKKKRSLLLVPSRVVPSRSSSNKQLASAGDLQDSKQEDSGQDSRSGIVKRYREASRASSRRSRRTQQQDSATDAEPKAPASEIVDPSKTEKKSKGSSKLFALLSCCGSSGADNEEPSLPAKKAIKPQPNHGRQSTPVEKAEVSAGESSTAESRDPNPFNEKATLKASVDQRSSLVENEGSEQAEGSAVNKPGADESLAATNEGRSGSLDHRPSSRRGPSGTSDPNASDPNASEVTAAQGHLSGTNIPESQADALDQSAGPSSGQTQRDPDVAVAEPEEVDDDPSIQAKQHDTHQLHNLPPPPPLDRDHGKHVPPVPMVNPETPKWLLPPIQPRFKDRKCLVLDLDETLVHSSFKVGIYRSFSTYVSAR